MRYHNSVPQQPSSQWLINAARKEVHVLEQKKALHQTPSNSTALYLRPSLDVGWHRKGLIAEPKGGLPTHLLPRKGRDMRPSLCNRPNTATGFSDSDSPGHSGGSSWGGIPWTHKWLLDGALYFPKAARGGGGGGVESLPWGSCCCVVGRAPSIKWSIVITRLVTISSSPGSDSAPKECTDSAAAGSATWMRAKLSGLSTSWWMDRFLETISAKASLMGSKDPTDKTGTNVPSFTNCWKGREQVGLPYVYVQQQGAIH